MKVKVQRPTNVPVELRDIWDTAARKIAKVNKLFTKSRNASGGTVKKINYPLIDQTYKRLLKAGLGDTEELKRVVDASSKDISVYRPEHVPTELWPIWHSATQRATRQGKLFSRRGKTASGKPIAEVNYPEINRNYIKILQAATKLAIKEQE